METRRRVIKRTPMSELLTSLKSSDCEIEKEFPMSRYITLKVGGIAEAVVYPANASEFINILNTVYESGNNFLILGAGSNTIIQDTGYQGVVISTKKLRNFTISGNYVHAECGAMLSTIMKNTVKKNLTGFEFAAGIPGTVGGGIFMNAGANNGEIKDVVEEVTIWHEGKVQKLGLDQLSFEYRKCHLPEGSIITNAVFRLEKGNQEKSEKNIKEYLDYRNITQPVNMANTGSIFKNPENIAAGKLLEELGLKGEDIGGARFSELHANFIVNGGNALASDVIKLIKKAQKMALEQRGITLETEVRIIE